MKLQYFLSFVIISLFIFNDAYSEEDDVLKVKIIEDLIDPEIVLLGFITSGTLIGLVYTIYHGKKIQKHAKDSLNEDLKLRFAELLGRFEKDLQLVLNEERKLTEESTVEACHRITGDYLNILDRIAYLKKLEKMDDEMIDYFNYFFEYGLRYIWWKNMMNKDKKACEKWEHQCWWYNEKKHEGKISMSPYTDLGKILRDKVEKKRGKIFICEMIQNEEDTPCPPVDIDNQNEANILD